jgi:hypothetical protein
MADKPVDVQGRRREIQRAKNIASATFRQFKRKKRPS